jgi:hypothetical protein
MTGNERHLAQSNFFRQPGLDPMHAQPRGLDAHQWRLRQTI